jgi:hypothetical protein
VRARDRCAGVAGNVCRVETATGRVVRDDRAVQFGIAGEQVDARAEIKPGAAAKPGWSYDWLAAYYGFEPSLPEALLPEIVTFVIEGVMIWFKLPR